MIFKKLKIEFFYLRKMLRRRVGPGEFFAYYKNKYFGQRLFEKLPKWTSRNIDQDFEIHILSQKSMLWPMAVSIRSFLYHSNLCPKVIVHVEDEFDQQTIDLFESKFDNVKVLPWAQATKEINAMPEISDFIKKYRFSKIILVAKLIDGFLLSRARRVMILGTDVLFFSRPQEIIDFVQGATDVDGLASYDTHPPPFKIDEDYKKRHRPYEQKLDHLNSDLIIFDKSKIKFEWFTEFFDHITEKDDYFVDLVGYAMLFAQIKFRFLHAEHYKIKYGVDDSTVTKHFTGPRRDELYSYGLDLALKRMNNKL